MPNLCTRGVYVILSHTYARSLAYINTHTPRTSGGGGGTLLGTLGRCAQTVLRPGFDHIFASAVALRPITVNKNPCLHVVNLIIFSLSSSLSRSSSFTSLYIFIRIFRALLGALLRSTLYCMYLYAYEKVNRM